MSTLKALKTRIQSVQSTRKITAAMYMVAAAKFRKLQKDFKNTKLYAQGLMDIVRSLPTEIFNQSIHPFIRGNHASHTLIILISSDRGLCGSFNSQLFRKFKEYIKELSKQDQSFYILPFGKKAYDFSMVHYPSHLYVNEAVHLQSLHLKELENHIEKIKQDFWEARIGTCVVLYNDYISPLQQRPFKDYLLPLSKVAETSYNAKKDGYIPYFTPNQQGYLNHLLDQYIYGVLTTVVAETCVGEYAARMTAMDNATKNSDDIIQDLKLKYNQTRQARITRELIEIISGAEALQKG